MGLDDVWWAISELGVGVVELPMFWLRSKFGKSEDEMYRRMRCPVSRWDLV